MRRRDLEALLGQVPPLPSPRPELEQYRTPPAIAAGLLWLAHEDGAIAGRDVLDLGCGAGTFALGAAALGSRRSLGVDVDEGAVALARQAAEAARLADRVAFEVRDVAAWQPERAWDTVVMNPPFGAQAGNRHADRAFLTCALAALRPGGTAWFLALAATERFLTAFAREAGAGVERVALWDYPLEATMAFHRREAAVVQVGGYRMAVA